MFFFLRFFFQRFTKFLLLGRSGLFCFPTFPHAGITLLLPPLLSLYLFFSDIVPFPHLLPIFLSDIYSPHYTEPALNIVFSFVCLRLLSAAFPTESPEQQLLNRLENRREIAQVVLKNAELIDHSALWAVKSALCYVWLVCVNKMQELAQGCRPNWAGADWRVFGSIEH